MPVRGFHAMTALPVQTGRWHGGHAVLLGLAVVAVLLAVRALAALSEPLPQAPPMAPPALADRDLLSRFDPFFPSRVAAGVALPVTALPFSLHGIRADSASGRGSAIIASGDGVQAVYVVGDVIADGVVLAAIASDHVVLERGGAREALWLDSAGGVDPQAYVPPAAAEFSVPTLPQPVPDADGQPTMPSDVPTPAADDPLATEEPVFG
jgi:general secretion pathway protein C